MHLGWLNHVVLPDLPVLFSPLMHPRSLSRLSCQHPPRPYEPPANQDSTILLTTRLQHERLPCYSPSGTLHLSASPRRPHLHRSLITPEATVIPWSTQKPTTRLFLASPSKSSSRQRHGEGSNSPSPLTCHHLPKTTLISIQTCYSCQPSHMALV